MFGCWAEAKASWGVQGKSRVIENLQGEEDKWEVSENDKTPHHASVLFIYDLILLVLKDLISIPFLLSGRNVDSQRKSNRENSRDVGN